ncbi:hypothetical protein CHF27_011230 [Romboutsia maritimum]|uniref:Uncharacterized protein n=1 Tax=Romboutsia maritimum TaxID=2020948 RepID=A0A371IQZ1_9FIRM|nr:hypothetical protein [Romboutsia maritimum]RDY22884.1 hypothetical protein CHF27_011230 [Romboutsia maritimum]
MPSEISRIKDEYTAFCFDEACMYIITQLQDKQVPSWREDAENEDRTRKTFLDVHMKEGV